ncbi:MAG TPA: helix-turn-helix domain-containing protein [Solirubrobacterales bacterium]|nr:helix-turn-helix domain-containing protein [Solirubrobacterales bacterium]
MDHGHGSERHGREPERSPQGFKKTTSVFSAPPGVIVGIADPVRLELIRRLTEVEEATAAELNECCEASKPTVRRHLEALVAVGLVAAVEGTSDGYTPGRPATRFSLTPEISASVRALLSPYRPA